MVNSKLRGGPAVMCIDFPRVVQPALPGSLIVKHTRSTHLVIEANLMEEVAFKTVFGG